MVHSSTHTNTFNSLEDIARRKEELRMELDVSKNQLLDTVGDVFSPPPAIANSASAVVRNLGTGMVIFNGVRSGLKIVKVIRGFLKRSK